MSRKPTAEQSLATTIREHWSDKQDLSGSTSPWLTCHLANQMLRVSWRGNREDPDTKLLYDQAVLAAMAGIAPRDPIEGLLAAQMVAVHEASMECFRRAMLSNQTVEGRQKNLGAASKLSRTYAALLEALNRHRGKGQQVVRVEHVTVQAGGQAIVGAVTQGGGGSSKSEDRPHAQIAIAHASEPALRRQDEARDALPVALDMGKRRCRMHGGAAGSAAQAGNRNALKHGRYSDEAIMFRRLLRQLVREAREFAEMV